MICRMSAKSNMVRSVLLFSGRVQGVGFRQSTVSLAKSYKVGGTVCNLPDGRVELIMEGAPEEIKKLQEDVETRFAGFITAVARRTEPVEGLLPPIRIIW